MTNMCFFFFSSRHHAKSTIFSYSPRISMNESFMWSIRYSKVHPIISFDQKKTLVLLSFTGYFKKLKQFSFSSSLYLPALSPREHDRGLTPVYFRIIPRGQVSSLLSEVSSLDLLSIHNTNKLPADLFAEISTWFWAIRMILLFFFFTIKPRVRFLLSLLQYDLKMSESDRWEFDHASSADCGRRFWSSIASR